MKKGVALAIETIIVLSLGLTVLTVMVLFLNTNDQVVTNEINLRTAQTRYCSSYVQLDRSCSAPNADITSANIDVKLLEACKGLNKNLGLYPSCGFAASLTPSCVKECCQLYCPPSA